MDIKHLSDLTPDPKNARRHNPRNIGMIERALNEVGAARSIVVDEAGVVLAGNGLVEAAAQAGIERVRVVDADGDEIIAVRRRGLTEEQKTKLALYDNRTAELADWEPGVLAELAQELDLGSLFTDLELSDLAMPALPEPGAGGDEFDSTPDDGPTRAQLGDLWLIGGVHRLLVGDCTDPANVARLMGGELLRLIVTDPPYGVSYADKNKYLNAISPGNRIQVPIENDHGDIEDTAEQLWKPAFATMYDAADRGCSLYCFMPQGGDQMMMMMMMSAHWPPRHELIWLKNNHVLGRADYNYKHEPIVYAWKDQGHKFYGGFQTSVLEFDKPQKSDLHPTMKPIELIAFLIGNSSAPDEIIGDWFLGSGTTLIAAHRTGRRCYGCEISPRYSDVVLRRAEAEGLTVERAAE